MPEAETRKQLDQIYQALQKITEILAVLQSQNAMLFEYLKQED